MAVLEALESVLGAAAAAAVDGENPCVQTFSESGGLAKLEARRHPALYRPPPPHSTPPEL